MDVKIILQYHNLKTENRDVLRCEDCMKKICECLRMHAREIINFKNKRMKLLTNEIKMK